VSAESGEVRAFCGWVDNNLWQDLANICKAVSPVSGLKLGMFADTKDLKTVPLTFNSPISRPELLAFLLDARSYPHRPKHVRLKQTHCSDVLFAAPYVYKIKKPVNLGFLDFSTLEKRRYFSEREVELNKRLSPEAYLGVVRISFRANRLTLGPGDKVVEYAVKMRKLEGRYFFLRLLQKDKIGMVELDRIVSILKAFYEAQIPTDEIAKWGQMENLKISTDENFRQTEDFVGFTISRSAFETIRFYTENFYARNGGLFESRIREQRIRDCHGDLHLEHVHITPTTLTIYDCIEFNDRFRCIDIANDVAFLRWISTIMVVRIYRSNLAREWPMLWEINRCWP
jgi:uncharacterized protein